MAKPIFLVGFPIHANAESVYQVHQSLKLQLDDYHVLVYKEPDKEKISFEVLNAINATDIEITELIERTSNFIKEALDGANELQQIITQNNQSNDD